MKKRRYLLLELMIALSVVGFVLVLLIRHPYAVVKKEYELLKTIDGERLWELELLKIRKRAYQEASEWAKQKGKIKKNGYKVSCKKAPNSTEAHQYYLVSIYRGNSKKIDCQFFIEN